MKVRNPSNDFVLLFVRGILLDENGGEASFHIKSAIFKSGVETRGRLF